MIIYLVKMSTILQRAVEKARLLLKSKLERFKFTGALTFLQILDPQWSLLCHIQFKFKNFGKIQFLNPMGVEIKLLNTKNPTGLPATVVKHPAREY